MEYSNISEYSQLLLNYRNETFQQRRSSNGLRNGTFNSWLSRKGKLPLSKDIPLSSAINITCIHQAYEMVVQTENSTRDACACKWCVAFEEEESKQSGKSKSNNNTFKISSCPYCRKNTDTTK